MTTPLSRRAFTAAALAALVTGCAGHAAEPDAAARRPGDDRGRGSPEGAASTRPSPSARPSANGTPALGRSAPVVLLIPAIDVDTPLIPLGLAADGSVQVPPVTANDRAGWYRHSPTPGEVGPSVVLGHVTVGTHGDGVFRHLARLRRGDRIAVRREDGTTARFAVTAVRATAKADFPTQDVYGDVDRPELRLITCGGPRTGGGYRDNVIVFAALSTATAP
ncbi:class F sortase [Streptomyces sp. MUM 136J]|uniref:class F sortase n=1 Tax=Streptomyces sp. MUM 136J TaxID=2791992 RepID=UPI001F03D38F|nr:class F sortase [Streptomyces sp. MUM 136J]MCH0572576.1 class F sortase [Streptomyces sp. MUM 136J]